MTIFILIGMFSIYMVIFIGLFIIPLTIASIIGLFSIRFPKIFIYDNRFQVLKKSIIDFFTENNTFEYKDLKNIEFSKGFTDKYHIIVLILMGILGGTTTGGNSKADQMIVRTFDDKTTVINRFGKKTEFVKTIELIKNNIKTGN